MTCTSKSMSAEGLAVKYEGNRKTALLFTKKVRIAMKSSESYPLSGHCEVDEAVIGGKRGAKGNKKIFIKHIDKTALVKTDEWTGYIPSKVEWTITQDKSKPKENFTLMHRYSNSRLR